jgi:hypothetical protein
VPSLSHSKSKISKIVGRLYEVLGPLQEKCKNQLMVDLIFFCFIWILYFCGYASLERVSLLFECMSCLLSFLGSFLIAFYISSERRPGTPSPMPYLLEVLLVAFSTITLFLRMFPLLHNSLLFPTFYSYYEYLREHSWKKYGCILDGVQNVMVASCICSVCAPCSCELLFRSVQLDWVCPTLKSQFHSVSILWMMFSGGFYTKQGGVASKLSDLR